ncbi:hypothetical protein EST38_g2127 [Candolleomyces aberdarensis]|uniref:Uncharacterized protein n=1 Tax=Candolleomyces aberdarensis TaxID=2316362 RepID=A0A4Q2DWU9_9AGAR|nr:hypothetical protein EST38_g2127 [Candolleomyces aberdarensis]
MHTLTWADNPLNHAVIFMHEGVIRLELRVEVFGCSKVDPDGPDDLGLSSYTYDDRQFMSLLYGIGEAREDGVDSPIRPDRTISMTLATQFAEIPRRMPNLQTLCLASFIPVSLYLPALLCTLFRIPPEPGEDDEEPDDSALPVPPLRKLRHLVIPRFYHCAPLLEHLAQLPSLETIDYQYIYGNGWGRPSDVGLDKCVPKGWRSFEREMEESRMAAEERRAREVAAMGQFAGPPLAGSTAVGHVDESRGQDAQLGQGEDQPMREDDQLEGNVEVSQPAVHQSRPIFALATTPSLALVPLGQRTLDLSSTSTGGSQLPATSSTLRAHLPEATQPSTTLSSSLSHPLERLDPVVTPTFRKLTELNLLIPLSDAKKLLLSAPPSVTPSRDSNVPTSTINPLIISNSLPTSPSQGFPGWPQNLVYLHINTPPGILTRPREIRALFEAIAYACYGPSTGRDTRPARLERLEILCCADADSGYEAMCETFGSVTEEGEEMCLSLKTIEPILSLLHDTDDVATSSSRSVPPGAGSQSTRVFRPRFALKTFEISHQFPMYLTQSDVETIAQRWGGCIEVLILCCEPMAAYGMTKIAGFNDDYQVPTGKTTSSNGPEATLTLAALLPLAKYCAELRHLALFVDATRGVKGLMRSLTDPDHLALFDTDPKFGRLDDAKWDDTYFDFYTSEIGRKYLVPTPPGVPGLPFGYPMFQKLLHLNMGSSLIPISIKDLDFKFTDGDDSGRRGQNLEDRTCAVSGTLGKGRFLDAVKNSARVRIQEKLNRLKERGVRTDLNPPSGSGEQPQDPQLTRDYDEDDFLAYIRANGVRLGVAEEDLLETKVQDEMGIEGVARRSYDSQDTAAVAMILAHLFPCFQSKYHPDFPKARMTNSAFTTVIESGTTWTAPAPALMSSSRAIQASYTLGEPYEAERRKERRRRLREERERQENLTAAADSAANPAAQPPPPPVTAATVTSANDTLNASSPSVVIPFFPVSPSFAEPYGYFPSLFSSVIEARTNRWILLNEIGIPSMVAMREEGWTWSGRVGAELKNRLDEMGQPVKEKVISSITEQRGRAPDECIIS